MYVYVDLKQYGQATATIISTPSTIKSSATITGDLGFKPPALRWNGKSALTTRQLQQQSQKQKMSSQHAPQEFPMQSSQTQSSHCAFPHQSTSQAPFTPTTNTGSN